MILRTTGWFAKTPKNGIPLKRLTHRWQILDKRHPICTAKSIKQLKFAFSVKTLQIEKYKISTTKSPIFLQKPLKGPHIHLQRPFSSNTNTSSSEKEPIIEKDFIIENPDETYEREDKYTPNYKITFDDEGYSLVLEAEYRKPLIVMNCVFFGLGCFLIYKGVTKLWVWSERRWYGVLAYVLMGLSGLTLLMHFRKYNNIVVERLWIHQNGRTVRVSNGLLPKLSIEVDIKSIEKGDLENSFVNGLGNMGYPIVFGEQELTLLRQNTVYHEGILSSILNQKYVEFEDFVEVDSWPSGYFDGPGYQGKRASEERQNRGK